MGKHSDYKAIPGYPNYYKSGNGLIIFRKRIRKKQVTIATGADSIREAQKIVEERMIDLLSSNPTADKRKRRGITNPMLKDLWVDMYKERAVVSEKSTLQNYDTSWKYGIEPFWGKLLVHDINHSQMTKFEEWYLKYRAGKSYFNVHKHLGMFFRHLKKNGYVSEVPPMKDLEEIIKKRHKKKKVGRVYTDQEINTLIENAVNARTKLGILIYRYMGCRKMEILASERIKWDLKKGVAEIWSFKNDKWRDIPIPAPVMGPLREWLTNSPKSKFLFPAPSDMSRHISSQVFDKDWTKTKKNSGLSNWDVENMARIHDLRHTFATHTANDNWPPMYACHVLDMSLVEYQRTYVHIRALDVKSLMEKSFGSRP